jgi:hypothetical protein
MEEIVKSIISEWKRAHPLSTGPERDSIQIKHIDTEYGIYTIYFKEGFDTVRIKAIYNPNTKFNGLIRKLKNAFGIDIKDEWKIIELK